LIKTDSSSGTLEGGIAGARAAPAAAKRRLGLM
jgi:hypothetical protein